MNSEATLPHAAQPEATRAATAPRFADEMLFVLGHELRNPVHALCAALDVADAAAPGSATALEAQAVAARQARRLAQLADELLDAGRVLTGRAPMLRQPLELSRVVDSVVRSCDAAAIQLQSQEAWVHGDLLRLEQAIAHVVKYAAERSGTVRVRLEVQARDVRPDVRIDVEWAGDAAQAADANLGLLLARRVFELHGGGLELHAGGCRLMLPALRRPA